ncbi:MAG: hypothetical protein EOO90_27045 [Pedobacter sp.]|nr:MAG: hypothetical protein EOO90_27045 [Pedobacter sp.]
MAREFSENECYHLSAIVSFFPLYLFALLKGCRCNKVYKTEACTSFVRAVAGRVAKGNQIKQKTLESKDLSVFTISRRNNYCIKGI